MIQMSAADFSNPVSLGGGARPSVSCVVVSYNSSEHLSQCLGSLRECDQVIVVDNASTDGSAELVSSDFPSALLVRNEQNLGFGAACNIGIDLASSELVLILNADCFAKPEAVSRLASAFADQEVIAAGGALAFPGGQPQASCANALSLWAVFCEQTLLEKLFRGVRPFDGYWLRPTAARDVEQVMGACLMMRPVLRFDERFFLYCEDTDLCFRLRQLGRIRYEPSAQFTHVLGASSARRWEAVARYNRGKELYFAKHHGRLASAACWLLDRLGALLRLGFWTAGTVLTLGMWPRARSRTGIFARVLLAPIRGPRLPPDSLR